MKRKKEKKMKKLAVVLFVALLGLAFTAPAFALENVFGGYWRARFVSMESFNGSDNDPGDIQQVDTRTRLYYTAVINDNLKFVNKFEMDSVWGVGGTSYGDIGADGIAVEVKNSYIDFNTAGANFKIGTMGGTIQRGFIFADDFSGIVASMNGFTLIYGKVAENGDGPGEEAQMYNASYALDMDGVKITPNFTYVDGPFSTDAYFLGLDVDATLGGAAVWATLIYEGGELSPTSDLSAFLVAAGFDMSMSDMLGIHGQAFYSTGEDLTDTDPDYDGFVDATTGASYYWAEIMGYGTFDENASAGAVFDNDIISGIYAINFGLTYAASDQLKFTGDLWYAALTEDDVNGETSLGTEIDLVADYTVVEGLNLKLVAAYLFAGDATTGKVANDDNPMLLGAQFSISF